MFLDKSTIQALPKVLLHEHLDGSMRPQTIIELAKDAKYTKLPTADPAALADWFYQGAYRGDLARLPGGLCPHHRGNPDG